MAAIEDHHSWPDSTTASSALKCSRIMQMENAEDCWCILCYSPGGIPPMEMRHRTRTMNNKAICCAAVGESGAICTSYVGIGWEKKNSKQLKGLFKCDTATIRGLEKNKMTFGEENKGCNTICCLTFCYFFSLSPAGHHQRRTKHLHLILVLGLKCSTIHSGRSSFL